MQTVFKISGKSGRFSDILENFWTVLKVSGESGKCSGQSPRFPESLEDFWTGWKISDHPLIAFLDSWFGSRGRWHFKTGSNKFYTSEMVDRKKYEVSRLSFLNNTFNVKYTVVSVYCLRHLNHTFHLLRQKVT